MPPFPPRVRAVFFDAVGTLLFPEPGALAVYADRAREHGLHLSPAEVRARFVAAYHAEEIADESNGWATGEERERRRWRRIVTDTLTGVSNPESCFERLFDHFARPESWKVAPDAEKVLSQLASRGLVLGMGSNYDRRLWSVLDGFPALDILRDRVLISGEIGVRKPGEGFFRAVCEAAGCSPAEVLFVGDDLGNDFHGATAAGMPAVLLDPHGRHADIEPRVTSLSDLLR
ncbi:MAG: HAD family hydrolase [Gemmataceae bacterium]|nr:HAD family hydrolase [Gemmataceae bacterium]